MRKSDCELGMGHDITRRDFLHDSGLAALDQAYRAVGELPDLRG